MPRFIRAVTRVAVSDIYSFLVEDYVAGLTARSVKS
jgi:hypothetical protein